MDQLALDLNSTNLHSDTEDEMPNIHEWFLMRTPVPVACIMISYWLFVLKLGPMYMKDREPLQVKPYLVAYNIFQVFVSLYTMLAVTKGAYAYLLAKISELLDTIFFVVRKNARQVTFLHVYHHSITVLVTWTALKIESVNASAAAVAALNGFVHVVMYTYYGLAAFSGTAKHLCWKKYITSLQIIQFFTILAHQFVSYRVARCEKLNFIYLTIIFHLFLFVYLFIDFYVKTYAVNNNVESNLGCKSSKTKQNKVKLN